MSDDSLYVIHGGSDFDKINPSRFGSGEPGNIRPLGKGLYSFVIDHEDPKRAAYAIDYAKHYSKKYGYGDKAVHVFKIPKSISTSWNGDNDDNTKFPRYPRKIEGLGGYPEKELAEYEAINDKYKAVKGTPEEGDSWLYSNRAYERLRQAADVQFEHLPIGLTEASIHNPEVATRIGKFDLDTPTEDILGMVKNDAANVPHKEDGGSVMDTAIHKGKPFWSGVFDANDGFIREVHPYKRAKAADFHHSYYVSSQSQDAMKQGDAGFFWVDPDGSVNTDWREGKAPKHIVDAIQDQIEPIPHKDNGGGVTDPNTDVPPSPGESPIPEGNVRLYHQTAASNIPSILKNGITFENAKGIEGPKAIYADEKGFYGKPGKVPTIEFSIPKERWTHPPFVLGDVKPSEIVAAHLPWHETVRYLEEFPDQIKRTLQGEHDNLMDGSGSNEDKAVRYIKQKYKPHKDNGGSVTLYHGTGKTIDKFKPHTYFATAPETSKKYATYRRGPNPQTYRVEANLTRPAKMADYRAAKEELGNSAVNEDVFSYLQSKGFDHFIPYSGEVVVFDPEKSTKPKFDNGGGITAYQGGPHSVGEEGFLDEKIGTGEGAQAYGHGHYFAEAEPVAQGYRDALVQKRNPTTSINDLIGQMSKNSPESRTPKNIQWYMKQDPMLSPHADDKEVVGHISEALNGQNADGSVSESAIDAYGKLTDKFGRNHKGHMHEVSINAHPDHFLIGISR